MQGTSSSLSVPARFSDHAKRNGVTAYAEKCQPIAWCRGAGKKPVCNSPKPHQGFERHGQREHDRPVVVLRWWIRLAFSFAHDFFCVLEHYQHGSRTEDFFELHWFDPVSMLSAGFEGFWIGVGTVGRCGSFEHRFDPPWLRRAKGKGGGGMVHGLATPGREVDQKNKKDK